MSAIAEVTSTLSSPPLYTLANTSATSAIVNSINMSNLHSQKTGLTSASNDPYSWGGHSSDIEGNTTELVAASIGIAGDTAINKEMNLISIFSGTSVNVSVNDILSRRPSSSNSPIISGSSENATNEASNSTDSRLTGGVAQNATVLLPDFISRSSALTAASGLLANPGAVAIPSTGTSPPSYAIDSEITAINATTDSTADDPHNGTLALHSSLISALMVAAAYESAAHVTSHFRRSLDQPVISIVV